MSGAGRVRPPLWLRWWASDAIIMGVCAIAVLTAFLLVPGAERVAVLGWEIPEVCAIKRFTGYPCPGCGLTRSWVYLAHGDWRTALSMNVLGPILFLTAVLQIPLRSYRIVRGYRARRAEPPPPQEDDDPCPA